jgi:hypothetical protein
LTLVAAAALLAAACTSPGQQRTEGTALEGGTQSDGIVGNEHVKVGETWWFALPVPTNKSSDPIEITAASLVDVPKGLKVLKYGAYSLDDTEGLALLAKEGDKFSPPFEQLRDYSDKPVKVAAHASSDVYYLARLRITSLPKGNARYCKFEYRQGDREFTQTLDCEVQLTAK